MIRLANISMFERLASRPITNAAIFNDTFDDVVAGGSTIAPVEPEVVTPKEEVAESLVDALEEKKPSKYPWSTVEKACSDAYRAVRALELYIKVLRLEEAKGQDELPAWSVELDQDKIKSLAKRIGMISGIARRAWNGIKELRDNGVAVKTIDEAIAAEWGMEPSYIGTLAHFREF